LSPKSKNKGKKDKPEHPIRKEILGLVFLLLAIILCGSLLSYHPSDKLFWNVTDPVGKANNLFGAVGAHLAGSLFFLMGFSSLWLVIFLLFMALISFRGRPLQSPIVNFFAGLLLLVSFSGIMNLPLANRVIFRGESIQAGGLMGQVLAERTMGFLNYFGTYLLLLAIFIISLMIITGLSLGGVFSKLGIWII